MATHLKKAAARPVLLLGLTVLAMFAGAVLVRYIPAAPAPDHLLEQVTPPRPLPLFALQGANGAFANSSMQGQWWLVVFGYAGCPDVCPTTLAQLARVHRLMVDAGNTPPRVLFVSVDPRRDTPQVLQAYVSYFSPGFTGVSGSPAQLTALADALGASLSVPARAAQGAPNAAYAVGHSTAVLLIDPNGCLVARVSQPLAAGPLADALIARQLSALQPPIRLAPQLAQKV